MIAPAPILVGLGGALGASLRYAVGEALADADAPFPASTLAVNTLGTFALGLLTVAGAGDDALLLLGTGTCGAFTTFSSFSVETVRAWEDGDRLLAVGYALGTLALAGVALGFAWAVAG
ncbi:fluoride efflux transporter CrcB [Halolamina sediminis]|uniref:fluoride efflux transporter CrcB n=1 Tax=Halolamina sediminis TaxID=1480675 RepID=UPI0006B696E8|nr:fluoride efflux transporter CrcB [Halolamina sediminis]